MTFKDFLEGVSRTRSFRRQLKLKEKEGQLESRAFRAEKEAELATSVGKKRKRIKEAKRKAFEETGTFRAIEGFKAAGRSAAETGKKISKFKPKTKGLGVSSENLFFGGDMRPSPRRDKKKRRRKEARRRDVSDDMFSDIGTDRFF